MGSQPIRIQLGKILWENLVGNSCGKILWEKGRWGKSQFKKGSDWWKFSIWNRVMGSQPIRIQVGKILREMFAGKSCRKFLQEILVGKSCRNLAGNCCRKLLWENFVGKSSGKCCGKFPIPISKPFLMVIFKICNSSRSTSFSIVNVKNSFLKPILNRFSHMTHQIEA